MAFNILPIELNEHIAGYLSADKDVANFAKICQATHNAIESHRCGLWRRLYASKFDLPEGRTGIELKTIYKVRCRALRRNTNWQKGLDRNEDRVLRVLRDLVCDSYAHVPLGQKATTISNNILTLRDYIQKSNFLDKVLSFMHRDPRFSRALKALQLVLFHFQLEFSVGSASLTYGFNHSQKAVYSHPSKASLFQGKNFFKVNIDFLVHTANFFKYHMTVPQAQTLCELFNGLQPHERPRAWDSRIHQGPGVMKLGKHWKGSYAYLHDHNDMRRIRTASLSTMSFTDSIDYHDGLQTLELDFSPAASSTPWPKAFERHLHALPPLALCKKLDKLTNGTTGSTPNPTTSPKRKIHYEQFRGSGTDAEQYHCNGILHPLLPQHDIPGWQRITLMKYFDPDAQDTSTSSSPPPSSSSTTPYTHSPASSSSSLSPSTQTSPSSWPDSIDKSNSFTPVNTFPQMNFEDADIDGAYWAYEGVVLPGGKIILGRWWSPLQDVQEMNCIGPFIFWEVDEG